MSSTLLSSDSPLGTSCSVGGGSGSNRSACSMVTGADALRITSFGSSPLALEMSAAVSRIAPGVGAPDVPTLPVAITSPAFCQACRYGSGLTTPS